MCVYACVCRYVRTSCVYVHAIARAVVLACD